MPEIYKQKFPENLPNPFPTFPTEPGVGKFWVSIVIFFDVFSIVYITHEWSVGEVCTKMNTPKGGFLLK